MSIFIKLVNRLYFLSVYIIKNEINILKSGKKIFLLVTPNHGNIGDQTISIAEIDFLKNNFNYPIIEISDLLFEKFYKNRLKKIVKPNDIIALHGGGNVGIEYKILEEQRRFIIKNLPKNRIILFPQTIDFGTTLEGENEFNISKEIYSNHKKLIVLAREEKSFEIFKNNFCSNTYLVPDIVLTLKPNIKHFGSNILTCFRSDVERTLSTSDKDNIFNVIRKFNLVLDESDTYVYLTIYPHNRKKIVSALFSKYQNAQLVITDRLHGMIFAYLNGTPCIVFDNYNGKVKGVYNSWLKESKNIVFMNSPENFEKVFSDLRKNQSNFTIEEFAKRKFDFLIEIINNG